MMKPRDMRVFCEEDEKDSISVETAAYDDHAAFIEGNRSVYLSSAKARKLAQRLIEIADWHDAGRPTDDDVEEVR